MLRQSAGRGLARGGHAPRRSSGPHHAEVAPGRLQQRQGPAGAAPHRKGFGQQLQDAKEVVERLGDVGPEYGFKRARMGPTMTTYAIPEGFGGGGAPLGLSSLRNSRADSSSESEQAISADQTRGVGGINGENVSYSGLKGGPSPALSEIGADASRPARYGAKGISQGGLKQVREYMALLEEYKSRMALWTVNLKTEDYLDLAESGKWPLLQRRLCEYMTQALRDLDLPALYVSVCEIGPGRLRDTGIPCPHIHALVGGWGARDAKGSFLLTPAVSDAVIQKACTSVGLKVRDRRSSGQLAPIRYSVRSYLGKYLTKTGCSHEQAASADYGSLIPRTWWNRSDDLYQLLQGHVFHLPRAFVAFVLQQRQKLEALGVCWVSSVVVGQRETLLGFKDIEVDRIQFRQPERLLRCLELFGHWLSDPIPWNRPGWGCSDMAALARQSEEQAHLGRLRAA